MDNPGGSQALGCWVCALVGQDEEGVREGRDRPGIPGQLSHLVNMMRSLRNSQHRHKIATISGMYYVSWKDTNTFLNTLG